MKFLSDFRADAPEDRKPTKKTSVVEIRDQKTGQALIVEHDGELDAFNIDVEEAEWRESEPHTDGVLVGAIDGEAVVVFIELTGRITDDPGEKETPAERKLRQLKGAADHFHPHGRGTPAAGHGAEHHDAFADDTDEILLKPASNHRVVGIVVATRQGSRAPTPPISIGSTIMERQFRQISSKRLVGTITFRELLNP